MTEGRRKISTRKQAAGIESTELLRSSYPWFEYAILLVAGVGGYEMKKPFGMMLHRIMGLPLTPVHSLASLAGDQAFQIVVVVLLAVLIHRRTGLPAAPKLERALYGMHRGKKLRLWAPGLLGALVCLILGGTARLAAARFGVLVPLAQKLDMSRLPHAVAVKLVLLYPATAVGAALSEEMLYRFGILSIIAWLVWLVLPKRKPYKAIGLWIAILVSGLLFGYVHVHEGIMQLPVGGTALQVVIAPETWAGIVFGYLYAMYGVETSMIAHASIDMIQLVPFVAMALKHAHH